MSRILLINGPNLNLLGTREPETYGTDTLNSIIAELREHEPDLAAFQSNSEAEIIERIHAAREDGTQYILINPAAFTHTSVALRDALAAVAIPFIEIHLSNPHRREPFRHTSYFSDIAQGVVSGFGKQSYMYALDAAQRRLNLND